MDNQKQNETKNNMAVNSQNSKANEPANKIKNFQVQQNLQKDQSQNQQKPVANFNGQNKRSFTESELSAGTYNGGMKKTTISKSLTEKVSNFQKQINESLDLDSIETENLISTSAIGSNPKNTAKNSIEKTIGAIGQVIKSKAGAIKVIFLGGIGEIGKNMTAIECGDDMIVIDCGLAFPSDDMPGVDLVIPDFTYVRENAHKLKGIVITHGHEDHIGSLPYLLKDVKAPIYGSKITLTLLDNKIREHKISGVKGICVKPGYVVKIGCFTVEFIKVNHSIPGAFAIAIDTPAGIIFHTGDFKIDYEPIDGEVIDLPRIAEIGRKGVTLMLGESTNVERPGYTISEKRVGENLERIFIDNAERRLFVATFSSNIYRVEQIIELAIKYKRRVAVVGRSMINNIDSGMKIGAFRFDPNVFIDIEKIASLEDKNVLVLSTGSQGEPRSALSRLASGEFSRVEIGENDTVIFSSSPIPGNESMINGVINNLYKKGAIVITENVHASGHACQEELKTIHNLLKPKFFIPVHGEYRHLKEHVLMAEKLGMPKANCLIPEIGNVVEITKQTMVLRGNVQAGEQLVDGLGIGDVGSVVLRDRKLLSEDGLVIVVLGVSESSGEIISEPYLITRGFVYSDEANKLGEEAKQVLHDTLVTIDFKEVHDWNEIRNSIRKPLRNFFYKKTMRTPMILPIIFRI